MNKYNVNSNLLLKKAAHKRRFFVYIKISSHKYNLTKAKPVAVSMVLK